MGDFLQWNAGIFDEFVRMLDPVPDYVLMERKPEDPLEPTPKQAWRHSVKRRQVFDGHLFLDTRSDMQDEVVDDRVGGLHGVVEMMAQ